MSLRDKTNIIRRFVIEDFGDGVVGYTCEFELGNRTGPRDDPHMQVLLRRAEHEGKPVITRRW